MSEVFKIFVISLIILFGCIYGGMLLLLGIPEVEADVATTSVTVGNAAPSVSNVVLNGGSDITLTENTATTVECTATLTDNNGGSDITSANAVIFRSGVGSSCTADDNNCYQVSCVLGDVSGNDRNATCTAQIWFHADPTDSGTYASENWDCEVTAQDSQNATGSATTTTPVELNTLVALDVTPSISYGTLAPGQTLDCSVLTIATTTGNTAIDANISGTQMCTDYPTCAGDTIATSSQHYATSSVVYGSGYALSDTPTLLEFTTGKPTTHPSNQAQNIYWGIQIPSGQPTGDYTGENTFTVTQD